MRYIFENGIFLMSVGVILLKRVEKKEGKLLFLYKFSFYFFFYYILYRNEIVLFFKFLVWYMWVSFFGIFL